MKAIKKMCQLNLILGLALMTSMQAHADQWTAWSKANQFYVTDAYDDIMRVNFTETTAVNPAGCINGVGSWVDIELNKEGRSTIELEQMINAIYISMATYRNVRLLIDETRCTPEGMRIVNGIGLQNP